MVKLVAKHPSEWHKSTINTIKTTFSNWASEATEDETKALMSHEKERMEKLEWMSKITTTPLVLGPAIWHFNPISLVSCIQKNMDEEEIYLAKTLYGEARWQNLASKKAVAWLIRNRLNSGIYGITYKDVVLAKYQFTCWNKKIDPVNYKEIQNPSGKSWDECLYVAKEVISSPESSNIIPGGMNYFSPKSQRALHKKDPDNYPATPAFAKDNKKLPTPSGVNDDDYVFYKN